MSQQAVQKNQETWVQHELRKLKRGTLVLAVVAFSTLGFLIGYYFLSSGPFINVSYVDEDTDMYVEWETKFPAKTNVEYGTSEVYVNETSVSEDFSTSHRVALNGLLPDK